MLARCCSCSQALSHKPDLSHMPPACSLAVCCTVRCGGRQAPQQFACMVSEPALPMVWGPGKPAACHLLVVRPCPVLSDVD